MGAFGPVHWIVLGLVVLLVFGGRGKLSGIMGDAAKGVRAFRDGLKGDDESPKAEEPPPPAAKPLTKPAAKPASRASAPRTTKAKTAAKPAAKPRAKTKA
jgi:sec-independent protein translocase protein TatA